MFGNKAKRQARKLSLGDWLLWSYEMRVNSDDAAVAVAQGVRHGLDLVDLLSKLHVACLTGAVKEAGAFYPAKQGSAALVDDELNLAAIAMIPPHIMSDDAALDALEQRTLEANQMLREQRRAGVNLVSALSMS